MGFLVLGGASVAAAAGLISGVRRWSRRTGSTGGGSEKGASAASIAASAAADGSSAVEVTDVVVIGAGFAGLACAAELKAAGMPCVVLEARDRPGGRAWSRPPRFAAKGSDGVQGAVEQGAEFIHGENVEVWRYMERHGLDACGRGCAPTKGVSTLEEGRIYAFLGGRLLAPEEVLGPEGKLYFDRIEAATEKWISEGGDPSISVGELLRRRPEEVFSAARPGAGAGVWPSLDDEQRLCESMMAEWYAADLDDYCLLEDRPHEAIPELVKQEPQLLSEDGDEGHWRVRLGYSALAERMAAALGEDIRYRNEVVKVDWDTAGRGGVAVSSRTASGEMRTLLAHCAVVTLPLACLQQNSVEFCPALPNAKRSAIDSIGSGDCYKIVLDFERPFWPEDMQFVFSVFSVHVWWPGAGASCLMGYAGGKTALRLLERSDEGVVEEALKQLQAIFVETGRAQHLPKLLASQVVRWPEDQYARMGYSYMHVGRTPPDARVRLREPSWPLLWAGEACHPTKAALVHGALETGEWAAQAALGASGLGGIGIVDLYDGCREMLDEVYEDFLQRFFPVEGELDDIDDMRAGLDKGDGREPEYHILVAHDLVAGAAAGRRVPAGCAVYEYYPTSDCGLLSYICVSEKHRRHGIGRRLLRQVELQLTARTGGRQVPLFAETHNAGVEDGIMSPLVRQEVLLRYGFRCLAFDYTQPPLSEQDEPCGGLRLLVKGRASLPAEAVIAYLDGFAGSVLGWNDSWKSQPYYTAQVEQLTKLGHVPASDRLPW